MTRAEGVPDSVWVAGIGIVVAQLIQLAGLSFQALELVSLGIAIGASLLLIRGTVAGWALAAFWAASEVSAPLAFGAPVWVAGVGLGVGLMLGTGSARAYCFTGRQGATASGRPSSGNQDGVSHASRVSDGPKEDRAGRSIWTRLSTIRISKKYAFLGFLLATLVLLPADGLLGRLHRGSGRGNVLVSVSFHAVGVASTLAQLGLIVLIVLLVRGAIR